MTFAVRSTRVLISTWYCEATNDGTLTYRMTASYSWSPLSSPLFGAPHQRPPEQGPGCVAPTLMCGEEEACWIDDTYVHIDFWMPWDARMIDLIMQST